MAKEIPNVGGAGPIVVGVLPKQPRRVALEARRLAEALESPIIFAYVQPNSYLVEWELKADIHNKSLNPQDIDEDMEADAAEVLKVLESSMAGSQINWSLKMLAGDPGKALTRLGNELHARYLVVGTRHKGFGAKISELFNGSTAAHVLAQNSLPTLVVPVHHDER